MPNMRIRKGFVVLGVALVVGLVGLVFTGTLGNDELNVSCRVNRFSLGTCQFTNQSVLLPGKGCLYINFVKVAPSYETDLDDEGNAVRKETGLPVGSEIRSDNFCSGLVWGQTTKTVEVSTFNDNLAKVCGDGDWSPCEMQIKRSDQP